MEELTSHAVMDSCVSLNFFIFPTEVGRLSSVVWKVPFRRFIALTTPADMGLEDIFPVLEKAVCSLPGWMLELASLPQRLWGFIQTFGKLSA